MGVTPHIYCGYPVMIKEKIKGISWAQGPNPSPKPKKIITLIRSKVNEVKVKVTHNCTI